MVQDELEPRAGGYFVHPTARVDEGAVVGEGTRIWHFCHVMAGARLGSQSVLGQNCFVAARGLLGDRVHVQNNVSIYDGVELADDVFCGPSVVFTNVTNPRAFISRKAVYQGTTVGRGASIGANATILPGMKLGEYSMVGAGAVVSREVLAFALVVGAPARRIGWVGRAGERLAFHDGVAECDLSGDRYREDAGRVSLEWRGELPRRIEVSASSRG
jgi:UDP-2-acetamido-3-amino-2,3-dideoxy-glucuronate N-acetyltransferase